MMHDRHLSEEKLHVSKSEHTCWMRDVAKSRSKFAMKGIVIVAAVCIATPAFASGSVEHSDPVAHVVFALAVILVAAKLAGDIAVRLGQPSVLGELVGGVILGNLSLLGYSGLEYLKTDVSIDM